jgi:hypothetical protein
VIVNLYVDGFNLYYSALRVRFPDCKWLDLRALAELTFPQDEIKRVRYFTARISARDGDPQPPTRQDTYLRALKATGVEVIEGQFRHDRRFMHRSQPCAHAACPTGDVIEMDRTEEKGSDVNLGTYLMLDAATHDCEMAVVLTNDSDLVEPLRLAQTAFGVRTVLFSPVDTPNKSLRQVAGSIRRVRHGPLRACQLPVDLADHRGRAIHRPRAWRPEDQKR